MGPPRILRHGNLTNYGSWPDLFEAQARTAARYASRKPAGARTRPAPEAAAPEGTGGELDCPQF